MKITVKEELEYQMILKVETKTDKGRHYQCDNEGKYVCMVQMFLINVVNI